MKTPTPRPAALTSSLPSKRGRPPKNPPKTLSATGSRVIRTESIHDTLMRGGFPNARSLARDLEADVKTIREDLKWMQFSRGLPIEYDASRKGFYYTRKDVQFSGIDLTEEEMIGLCAAKSALSVFKGTALEPAVFSAFGKLVTDLQKRTSFDLDQIDEYISIGLPARETVGDPALSGLIFHSLMRGRELTFTYRKPEGDTVRVVEPHHLHMEDGVWYIICHDVGASGTRSFRLRRMHDVKLTGRRFVRRGIDWRKELANALGIFSGRNPVEVRVRLLGFAAEYAGGKQWHPSAKFDPVAPDRSVVLTMMLANSKEVERWVFQWADEIEVLSPLPLRAAVLFRARRMCELNHIPEE